MGVFYPGSEALLMIRIQNMCEKASLICLIPILVGILYMMALSALRPPLRVSRPFTKLKIRFNSVHRDEECA